jgi:hypothetical protein
MHCLMARNPAQEPPTSVSPEAVRKRRMDWSSRVPARTSFNPDIGHAIMRVMFRTIGFHKISES